MVSVAGEVSALQYVIHSAYYYGGKVVSRCFDEFSRGIPRDNTERGIIEQQSKRLFQMITRWQRASNSALEGFCSCGYVSWARSLAMAGLFPVCRPARYAQEWQRPKE